MNQLSERPIDRIPKNKVILRVWGMGSKNAERNVSSISHTSLEAEQY